MDTLCERIRMLNDELRRDHSKGRVLITSGVAALGTDAVDQILARIAAYSDFTESNNPYGENDFGSFQFGGDTVFWKIDYYDIFLEMHAPDPADPTITERVLTVLFAFEY